MIQGVPPPIQRAFRGADEIVSQEEKLWRERAARMTLDALGYTNKVGKREKLSAEHNAIVKYARRWFRGLYSGLEDPTLVDNAEATFDFANVLFVEVRDAVLAAKPILMREDHDRKRSSALQKRL